jgi:hypothetical protein
MHKHLAKDRVQPHDSGCKFILELIKGVIVGRCRAGRSPDTEAGT